MTHGKKALFGARFRARKREAGALRLAYGRRRPLSDDALLGGIFFTEARKAWRLTAVGGL
jgi:hypothetical protein